MIKVYSSHLSRCEVPVRRVDCMVFSPMKEEREAMNDIGGSYVAIVANSE